MPKWRRRQTQGTQNPPSHWAHEGSTPSFGILIFLFFLFSQELIDKIVAVVNEKPITLSEVNLMKKLENKEISFEEALNKSILLNLKYMEAIKYVSLFVSKIERENLLKELNLEDKALNREIVSKFIIIKRYVDLIIDPTIYINEEEIQNFIKENDLKITDGSKEYEDLKKLIFLKKENEILKDWENNLIKDAKIKIIN